MWRPFEIARAALAAEKANPSVARRREETEFLPAALEIVETPPSPGLRYLSYTLCGFTAFFLIWSIVGKVDVVASAEGRTIPSSKSKLVQPVDSGIVRAINVRDGDRVKAGDVLVELDSTGTGAERERLNQSLLTAELQAARVRAILAARDAAEARRLFAPPRDADRGAIATQIDLMVSEIEEHAVRLAQLKDEVDRRRAEAATIRAGIQRIDRTLPLLAERAKARRDLADKGFGSRLQYLELEEQRVAAEQDRIIQGHRLAETMAAVTALESQMRSLRAEFRRQKSAELAEAEIRGVAARQELIKAEQKHTQQTLVAPIDGSIQQVAVTTIGGVVTPAQTLMVVVPDGDDLEIEARVLNKDVGFIRVGQPVELKIESFLFTRYGLIQGHVTSVSQDAILDERQIPTFATRIKPARSTISVDGREVPLTAGMTTTAEIKIGSRRLIEYLLSPVMRYRHEAFREN
jgi:hemolysin D